MSDNRLATLSTGVFQGLGTSVRTVTVSDAGLRTVGAGVFDAMTGLTTLDLSENLLRSLPARVFEPLTSLTSLSLDHSRGESRSFRPIARAGVDREIARNATVVLGAEGAENGFDDPLGPERHPGLDPFLGDGRNPRRHRPGARHVHRPGP